MYYKLKLIHGPNLNMLGVRQPEIYGHDTLSDIEQLVVSEAKKKGFAADCFQSNSEGAIIDAIQSCYQACDFFRYGALCGGTPFRHSCQGAVPQRIGAGARLRETNLRIGQTGICAGC